eukprot:1324099-Amorphochlora_amoeboformis.AAC.1
MRRRNNHRHRPNSSRFNKGKLWSESSGFGKRDVDGGAGGRDAKEMGETGRRYIKAKRGNHGGHIS